MTNDKNQSQSSMESFIKSQESLVQGAIRNPKPINILQTQFDGILNKYKAPETAKFTKSKNNNYVHILPFFF